ncbi:MAG: ribonuclease HI family protein [Acidithiobacillales bacterium]
MGESKQLFVVYFDGASRGNPGPAAWGVFAPPSRSARQAIGAATNNVAEWLGFLAALDLAAEAGATDVEVRADSELVLKQFLGTYRVKATHLRPYLEAAREKARRFRRLSVVHVPRFANREADALANAALDEAARAGR